MARRRRRRGRRAFPTGHRNGTPAPVEVAASSWSICRVDAASGRFAGSGWSNADSTGVSGPARRNGRRSPAAARRSTSKGLSAVPNGGMPSTAANRVAPRAKTSDAGVASCPSATSEARNATVPPITPESVTVMSPQMGREIPKSASLAVPFSVTSMLPGLTSRCTISVACTASSAGDLSADVRHLVGAQGAEPVHDLRQALRRHVLHDQPPLGTLDHLVDEGDDVRVVQPCRDPGFAPHLPARALARSCMK